MIYIVGAYVLLCLAVFCLQKYLVYHPEKSAKLDPVQFGFRADHSEMLEATAKDGTNIRGWHLWPGTREKPFHPNAVVDLFFCGNGGHKAHREDIYRSLMKMGADVACFDYRGYGDSDGSPSESGLALDARAAWDALMARGVRAGSVVIHGESLGGGVAVRLASELCKNGTPPAGLIVQASFTRLRDVGAKHYPFLPVRLILTQYFPSVERIRDVTCPVLILHGKRDNVVPFELGRELFEVAPAKSQFGIEKQFVELPNCGHNDVGLNDATLYNAAVTEFYKRVKQ